jgi:hypothetical protein
MRLRGKVILQETEADTIGNQNVALCVLNVKKFRSARVRQWPNHVLDPVFDDKPSKDCYFKD